jgi:hypothetical protein
LTVPARLTPASAAIDALLALADQVSPELRSRRLGGLAALAGLALGVVGGLVLPNLVVDERGQ